MTSPSLTVMSLIHDCISEDLSPHCNLACCNSGLRDHRWSSLGDWEYLYLEVPDIVTSRRSP